METAALVERFVNVLLASPDVELDDLIQRLEREDISNDVAECLLAFVPMAFAHVLLAPMGVKLPERFKAWDPDTNDSEFGLLKDEPIFSAALTVASRGLERGEEALRVRAVASSSAEWDVVRQLTRDGSDPSGTVLTEPLLARVPLSYFRRRRVGSRPRSVWGWLTGR